MEVQRDTERDRIFLTGEGFGMRELVLAGFFATVAPAAVLNIPYTGGMQTGTFEMKGTSSGGVTYPDTVIIDGSLRVVSFTAQYFRTCTGGHGIWMFLENAAGPVGVKPSLDTVWMSASAFPAGSLLLDSLSPVPDIIIPSQLVPPNLSGTAHGIKLGTQTYGGVCYGTGFNIAVGHNRVVYFRLDKQSGSVYGKLKINVLDVLVTPTLLLDGPSVYLVRVQVAFTLSSSADLNSGPVAIMPARSYDIRGSALRNKLIWSERAGVLVQDPVQPGNLYDLKGKRRSLREKTR